MFCILEHDVKTYTYFRRYLDCFEQQSGCLELDNKIQAEELEEHLRANGFAPTNTKEKLNWITTNGKPFREYLNTIKLVYVLCKAQGIDVRAVSEDDFRGLEEKLNGLRHCLVSIF